MNLVQKILISVIVFVFISCSGTNSINKIDYIGNFKEKQYDFFESFRHNKFADFYYTLPFFLKFGGIRGKDYVWLRDPENLKVAFNAFSTIGLDKFISREEYFRKDSSMCCDTQWENKSLNEIVIEFLNSDTTKIGNSYYSKFWMRRKIEKNLSETYQILTQIDKFYNHNNNDVIYKKQDSILVKLLDFDSKLIHSDSEIYNEIVIEYFDFLKSTELDYSAYKLINHNHKFRVNRAIKDSLIMTIKHDTLSVDDWNKLNDNWNGWITGNDYPDPNRYYGP